MRKKTTRPAMIDEKMAEDILGGGEEYGTYLASTYFKNILNLTDINSPVAYRICHAMEKTFTNPEIEGFPAKKDAKGKEKTYPRMPKNGQNKVDPKDWETLKKYFEDRIAVFAESSQAAENTLYKNLRILGKDLYLSSTEVDVLRFLYVAQGHYPLVSFIEDLLGDDRSRLAPAIARLIAQPKEVQKISMMLDPTGSLTTYGLIDLPTSEDFSEGDKLPAINESIQSLLILPNMAEANIVDFLIGKPMKADLVADDFTYLAADIAEIQKIVKKALKEKSTGVNIMLYGPAGSGKTALAGAIARSLDIDLYAVGEEDNQQSENGPTAGSTAQHRVGKLLQAHAFLNKTDKAILLFDEVEDLLMKGSDSGKKADSFSKIIVNRLLEKNPVVTIWACNDSDKFHESMRQRFSFSVYVDYPPVPMRAKIWTRQLEMNKVQLPDHDISYLAREYKAPPRMIANAVKNAAEDGVIDLKEIEMILQASSRITYGNILEIKAQAGVPEKFDLEFFNYERSHQNELTALMEAGTKAPPYAILMQGPERSGIKTFGRYMAEKSLLNQQEHDVRSLIAPSPTISPESRITSAFEEASDGRNLLVFSHLDAFAADPANEKSWEGDLTRLFMRHLIAHRMPVIAHSFNDRAVFPGLVADAFSLQMKINPLTVEQCRKAHKAYFGKEAPEDLKYPGNLVVGDFSTVGKIIRRSTNGHTEPTRLLELLKRQATFRAEPESTIGFGSARPRP